MARDYSPERDRYAATVVASRGVGVDVDQIMISNRVIGPPYLERKDNLYCTLYCIVLYWAPKDVMNHRKHSLWKEVTGRHRAFVHSTYSASLVLCHLTP